MQKVITLTLLALTLSSCGANPQKLPCDAWGCKTVEYDPNPLCRFEMKPTNDELLEILLSDDPWDLYEDGYEVIPPERFPYEHEPKVLPPESYVSPQCELTDEEAERLACRGDVACLQKLNQRIQMQQQIQQRQQQRQGGQPYQDQPQRAQGIPVCFFFGLICVD